jgi:hypothetical protein
VKTCHICLSVNNINNEKKEELGDKRQLRVPLKLSRHRQSLLQLAARGRGNVLRDTSVMQKVRAKLLLVLDRVENAVNVGVSAHCIILWEKLGAHRRLET